MRLSKNYIEEAFFKNRDYYELMEHRYNAAKGSLTIEPVTKEFIFRALESLKPGSRVLEIGCGVGSNVKWLAEHFSGVTFLGSDISEIGISYALQKVGSLVNLGFTVDDIQDSRLESGGFSLIIAQSVFEHLTDYRKAVAECFRLLGDDGKVVVRVGNGGRPGAGFFGFLKDFAKYLLRYNRAENLNPTFVINSEDPEGRRKQHMENFDICSIPSDVLSMDFKKVGFVIHSFTTCRELSRLTERYGNGNALQRKLMDLYINADVFPFNHMGRVTVLSASKQVL
ncbi:MAG: class I SAM-dependent methyltransferase [Candidatus Aureabacteria bacterium]|nr:class I SAM-dependent methyltransferase [Candidatus Auribacterota bacterium]